MKASYEWYGNSYLVFKHAKHEFNMSFSFMFKNYVMLPWILTWEPLSIAF